MQILDHVMQWVELHPDYGLLLTFLMAFSESLLVVGGLIPGSIAITGIGILAGSGLLNIHLTFLVAILGAIIGDTTSFFIGRHFKNELKNIFIFKSYPKTLKMGQHYFKLHGGKSVFFGRFIGPVRAIIPAIAGMMNMPIHYFVAANVSSAIGWSALFFFPGVLIGKGHEQIQQHFQQVLVSFLIFICPFVILYGMRKIKLILFKNLGLELIHYFNKIKTIPVLNRLTPSEYAYPKFKTLTEITYLVLISIVWLISLVFARQIAHLSHYFLPEWLHHAYLASVFSHISYLNDKSHLLFLCLIFFVFIGITRKFHLLYSFVILMIAGLTIHGLVTLVLTQAHLKSLPLSPIIFSLGIQYLWLRILIQNKALFYYPIMIILITIWNVDTFLLSIQYQTPGLIYFFSGLWLGQITWMHARLKRLYFPHASVWLGLLLLEMILSLLF